MKHPSSKVNNPQHLPRACIKDPQSKNRLVFVLCLFLACFCNQSLANADDLSADASPLYHAGGSPLPDEWTASVLAPYALAIGTVVEAGLGQGLMVGADPAALALGARSMQIKWQLPRFGEDDWAVGVKYVSLSRKNLWMSDTSDSFSKLSANIVRPSVSWSNRISPRLIIHSFWATAIGKSEAALSDYGEQKLREAKHGSGESGDGHSFANRTMQTQSLAGFTEDRFQITAEWERNSLDRILLSTRFERTKLEDLETFSVRITLAQQWSADGFNVRLGGGPQYAMLSGRDLDGEIIKTAGWLPAADFALYWIL